MSLATAHAEEEKERRDCRLPAMLAYRQEVLQSYLQRDQIVSQNHCDASLSSLLRRPEQPQVPQLGYHLRPLYPLVAFGRRFAWQILVLDFRLRFSGDLE